MVQCGEIIQPSYAYIIVLGSRMEKKLKYTDTCNMKKGLLNNGISDAAWVYFIFKEQPTLICISIISPLTRVLGLFPLNFPYFLPIIYSL